MAVISHITLGTNDQARAAVFYDAVFGVLGLTRLPKAPDLPLAYERAGVRPTIYIGEPLDDRPATWGNGTHIALIAETRDQVHAFHELA
ncbi:MAG: VOC family protein, partial [Pseudomonadota bacterium]